MEDAPSIDLPLAQAYAARGIVMELAEGLTPHRAPQAWLSNPLTVRRLLQLHIVDIIAATEDRYRKLHAEERVIDVAEWNSQWNLHEWSSTFLTRGINGPRCR